MSEFIVDKITNREGTSGPQIAGITTFSGTSGIVMPNGNGNDSKLPDGYISDRITLYIDVSHPDSYTIGSSSITDIILGAKDEAFHGDPAYQIKDGVASLYFDGSDDGIRMDSADAVAYMETGDPLTFSTWVYLHPDQDLTSGPAGAAIMSMQQCNSPSFQIWAGSSGSVRDHLYNLDGFINFRVGNGDQYVIDSGKPDNPTLQTYKGQPATENLNEYINRSGAWVNIVGTYEQRTAKLYINGRLVGTCISLGAADYVSRSRTATTLAFMNRHPCGSVAWNRGWFHMASVHRKVLNDAEVLQNYDALKGRFGL